MNKNLLDVKHLTVKYGENIILNDLSLELGHNNVFGLVGFNGAGKSTLIETISGVRYSYSVGDIVFNQCMSFKDFNQLNFKRQRYTVFDYDQSFSNWNLLTYLSFVQKSYDKKFDINKQNRIIKGFNFEPYRNSPLSELSFGNRKKVFLIAGLLLEVPLLLLDEPVDGLDFESTEFLYKEIREYTRYGSVLMVSHLIDSLNKVSDELFILKGGRLYQNKSTNEIYRMMGYDY